MTHAVTVLPQKMAFSAFQTSMYRPDTHGEGSAAHMQAECWAKKSAMRDTLSMR